MVACSAPALVAGEARTPFQDDCEALTRDPHRLAGTEAGARAGDYVLSRLEALGINQIVVQPFPVAQTRIDRCELVVGPGETGRRLDLLPAHANGIAPSVTPPEGLSGPLFHAGMGRLVDYGNRSPEGAIVVLDYNAGQAWRTAFRKGAKAVVFTAAKDAEARSVLHSEASVNLPRYYYPGPATDLPAGAEATLHAEIHWERRTGRNIIAFLPGTQPTFQLNQEEAIVIAAPLDTSGEVPRRSPGARGAVNCAILLRWAEYFQQHRPRRHLVLAFLDAQARQHAGAGALYRAVAELKGAQTVASRRDSIAIEKKFIAGIQDLLDEEDPFSRQSSTVVQKFGEWAKEVATARTRSLRQDLSDVRLNRPPGADARIEEFEKLKARWNELLRAVANYKDRTAFAPYLDLWREAKDEIRRSVEKRQAELISEEAELHADERLRALLGELHISLHLSLLFGDAMPAWGLLVGGDSDLHAEKDLAGLYGKVRGTFKDSAETLGPAALDSTRADLPRLAGAEKQRFEMASIDGTLSPSRLLMPAPSVVHSGEVAGLFGLYNAALATAQEPLVREGTPADTLERLKVARMGAQGDHALLLLAGVVDRDSLSMRHPFLVEGEFFFPDFKKDQKPHGPRALGKDPGSSLFNRPMANAVVQVFAKTRQGLYPIQSKRFPGFNNYQTVIAKANGAYAYGPVPTVRHGVQGFAADFDDQGRAVWSVNSESIRNTHVRLNMIKGYGSGVVLPPLVDVEDVKVLNAVGDSLLERQKSFSSTFDGLVYWYCEEKVENVRLFNAGTVVVLRAPGADEDDLGGIDMTGPRPFFDVAAHSATDLWWLDEERMRVQRSRGIINSSVEELQGRAEDLMLRAETAESTARQDAMAVSSFWSQWPIYSKTRGTLDDLVRAVLGLLALSVPFAFALERLLIGATSIYRQILGFVGFFLLTFLVLYFTHPAFTISNTPLIIFLGFANITLSSLTIFIIMRKFEVELKILQGMTSTVHAADVSRFSTVMAAISMGISTMRRRPVRTALTAITIILLTFTILCFASFDTRLGVMKVFVGHSPRYAGAFINRVNWESLPPDTMALLRGRWQEGKQSFYPRYWFSPSAETASGILLSLPQGERTVAMSGVLGIAPGEIASRPDMSGLLGALRRDEDVLLTQAVAERLGLEVGDEVVLGGTRLRLAGTLDEVRLDSLTDLGGDSILPVDFLAMEDQREKTQEEKQAADLVLDSKGVWSYLSGDAVALSTAATARALGGRLHAAAVYAPDTEHAARLAESLARIFPFPITATREDGVYLHARGTILAASGARDLFFPILLGGLVIFGTMLGSVTDREREIYTFSALGLAPPHVAMLFFAEAMIYSVVGGLGGYLFAQGSMHVFAAIADGIGFHLPEMNYSSTNALMTILLVMATVLLSAVYPAIKASRSANPGLLRSWRLPTPEGDVFNIAFPFTVSAYDITGVVSFLKEHFENYEDVGLGVFMAKNPQLVSLPDSGVGLDAMVALAPFDLGVTETFQLRTAPSAIPGIDEVYIRLERLSGQHGDWRRLNKTLLDDLRRQFLIWRSLPQETMEHYRQLTLSALGQHGGETAEEGSA